ncbi:hypothetical protein SCUP234_01181 [Seiridium cupressi]
MDDWQETALSSRHMHNRVGRNHGQAGGRSRRYGSFDVRKTFGSYSCKCPAWKKVQKLDGDTDDDESAVLDLYRLTGNGQGIVGELVLPDVLRASVILAASRKNLRVLISSLVQDDSTDDDDKEGNEDVEAENAADAEQPEDMKSHSNMPEETEQDRFATFEKNSFRSPKFWLQWSGTPEPVVPVSGDAEPDQVETGLGYIVFSGNDCRKFSGTINSSKFGWKDASISGHKIASRSESDVPVIWAHTSSAL